MEKIYYYLSVFTLLGAIFIVQSCNKDEIFDPIAPDAVVIVVENEVVAHTVNIEVKDANANASNQFPANAKITLEGADVESGLIYSTAGNAVTTTPDNAKIEANVLTLFVKKGVVISSTKPITFYVKATADKYLSNSKEIRITSLDSLQYVTVTLMNKADLPKGVVNTTATTPTAGGTIAEDFVVKVSSSTNGVTEEVVSATVAANTTFFDATNTAISTAGDLNISVTDLDPEVPESLDSFPGGTSATTENGENVVFSVAGVVNITASIGQTSIKTFSTPIPFTIKLSPSSLNPATNSTIKAGDQLPVWSKNEGAVIWKQEGLATVVAGADGKLKTTIQVTHLSDWMVGGKSAVCGSELTVTYTSTTTPKGTYTNIFLELFNGTESVGKKFTRSVTSGDTFTVKLPEGTKLSIKPYLGIDATGVPLAVLNLTNCQTVLKIVNNDETNTNKLLLFDLQTKCGGALFNFSGDIEFRKLSSVDKSFRAFGKSVKGILSTKLLTFGERYEFRASITYTAADKTQKTEIKTFKRTVVGDDFAAADAKGYSKYIGKFVNGDQRQFFTVPGPCGTFEN
jgi:hypothetical protein